MASGSTPIGSPLPLGSRLIGHVVGSTSAVDGGTVSVESQRDESKEKVSGSSSAPYSGDITRPVATTIASRRSWPSCHRRSVAVPEATSAPRLTTSAQEMPPAYGSRVIATVVGPSPRVTARSSSPAAYT